MFQLYISFIEEIDNLGDHIVGRIVMMKSYTMLNNNFLVLGSTTEAENVC